MPPSHSFVSLVRQEVVAGNPPGNELAGRRAFRLCEKDAGKIRIRVIYGDMGHTGSACTLPDNSLMLNRSELSWLRRAAFDPTQAQAIKGKREPQQQRERGARSDSCNAAKSRHDQTFTM
jgi:hypothetical protein